MGLISAAISSASGVMADQWKEFFYCDALPVDVLAVKGHKKTKGGNKGNDNIISNGSVIAVADGQCMMIVDQGKIADICAEPGEYKYDASSEPSIFASGLNLAGIESVLATIGKRISFGGDTGKDQRVYYFNTKELTGNKYGTKTPIPFRVVDRNIGLDMDTKVKCFGEYSFRITNPALFYTNVCGNMSNEYTRDEIESQLKAELLTALQPAFAKISAQGVRYADLPAHTMELSTELNEVLSAQWRDKRGLEIVSFGISSISGDEKDEEYIKELQRNATLRDPNMAAAHLVGAQANAMQNAANNPNGAAMGFFNMGMANNAGGFNPQALYQQGAQQQQMQQQQMQQQTQAAGGWICPKCGKAGITGKFCPECGTKKPEEGGGWTCPSCGTVNKGKFCLECGAKKPAGEPQYRCDKCGWEPNDPKNPPKFCPECGDPFGDEDIVG